MTFSDRPFFADNQTINLKPFLKTTETPSQPTFVIRDGVAGGGALVLLIAGLLVWFKPSRKRKATPRGKILDATELRGAADYSNKELKSDLI
ncbi:hypothetical protein NC651_010671 [Populus alba x Populus x berolinensis]|nr:hypothetical protein NC651_010671 [Populus alba x Populus x berolinensis]